MTTKKPILIVMGTRPEAVKLAPVVRELRRQRHMRAVLVLTGQHVELLRHALEGQDLHLSSRSFASRPSSAVGGVPARLLAVVRDAVGRIRPKAIVVQGDTMSTFTGAMVGFLERIPVLHVEAGLRSGDVAHPFPEEALRRALVPFVTHHAAPTVGARNNLLRENCGSRSIRVVGNTVVDALYYNLRFASRLRQKARSEGVAALVQKLHGQRIILMTSHRRESLDGGLASICRAVRNISATFSDVHVIFPVHLNPCVREIVYRELGKTPQVHLVKPLSYPAFLWALQRCYLALTDSGGIQEEAPYLGKPVIVARDATERPEAVACGSAQLAGRDPDRVFRLVATLLTDRSAYLRGSRRRRPFGDGRASRRIVRWLEETVL